MRLIAMGFIAGLSEKQVLRKNPGNIIDLYCVRREYDEGLHGIERQRESDGDWD